MGHNTATNNILTALDKFLSSNAKTTIDKLNHISKLLETTPEHMSTIQHKFKYYLESTASWKIQKVLDLLEFLTIFNTGKLPSIVNTEKFMEVYATVIMEPEFKDTMLGMLRLWSDKYGNDRNKMDIVFNVTDNLQAYFEMCIPDSYKSKYEGIDPTKSSPGSSPKKSDPKKDDMPAIETVDSYLIRAETARKKAMSLLADVDFNETPLSYRKSVVGVLLDDIETLIMYLVLLEGNVLKPGAKETAEDLAKDLEKLHEELRKKIEGDSGNNAEGEANGEPEKKKKMKKNAKEKVSSMMELSDFMTYKTHQCKEGMGCKYAPVTKKGVMTNKSKAEVHCIYWHGTVDRRRLVCNEKGDLLYKCAMCRLKNECPRINNCGKSHNFYETYFHPLNYKKKKCSFPGDCRYKEHCPYYHSSEEKEKWKEVLREYFAMKEDEEEVVEEDDEDMEGDIEDNFRQKYNNAVRHMPPKARAPRDYDPPYSNGKVEYYPKPNQKSSLKVESMDIGSQKPKTKELHSKLMIRKEFVDPSKLTKGLRMNACFSGFSMMQGAIDNGKINGEVVSNKVEGREFIKCDSDEK